MAKSTLAKMASIWGCFAQQSAFCNVLLTRARVLATCCMIRRFTVARARAQSTAEASYKKRYTLGHAGVVVLNETN